MTSVSPLTLVYLARLRDALGVSTEHVDLPDSVRSVGELRGWLASRGGNWAHELAPGRAIRVAINHEMASDTAVVRGGDEVALFPPVTGG